MPDALRRKLPNIITVMRLVLAAAFFATLNLYRYPDTNQMWANLAILLFCAAAATDALDGYLARRWKAISLFGRIMDPFCDKVLIIGAFVYLAGPRFVVEEWVADPSSWLTMATGVYPWMVVVIIARELLVTGIRGVVEAMGVSFGSSWSGKGKMILQSCAVPVVLALVVNFEPARPGNHWAFLISTTLMYATVGVTVWSGWPYVARLSVVLTERREAGEPAK
jgi:phosphatidylglycerophosphate synthase